MDNTVNHIDELIGKHLSGEADRNEAEEVLAWASKNEANQKYLEHCRIIFEKAYSVKTLTKFDEDAAWNKLKLKIQKKDTKTLPFYSAKEKIDIDNSSLNWWRMAAGFIILLGISFAAYKLMTPVFKSVEVIALAKPVSNILPDGSDVFLNKQSKLNYSYNKAKNTHVVKLTGEAYFNIKHDKRKDFIIEVENLSVRDIGTSFNVKAYPQSNKIEVVVKEGEVVFYTSDDSVFLYAGDKGVYDKIAKQFIKEKPESNELAYKTKVFTFNDQELASVIKNLNAVYDKKIILDNQLNKCRLTVTFNNEDINEIATVIAETLNLNVRKTDEEIILEGVGCE